MSESQSHKNAKNKAAGKSGKTEVCLKSGQRLDASTKRKATEVERSGAKTALEKAVNRLKESRKPQRVLQVPQNDMKKVAEAMKNVGTSETVKNLSGTKRTTVKK